jgi:hypothetical protein
MLMSSRRIPRRVASFGALVLASGLVASCGGGAPPPLQVPVSPASSKGVTLAAPPPPPDLSQVPDPASLVVSGRVARPGVSLGVIQGWSHLPLAQADQITELVAGEALGPLVDLDAPIDFAVATLGDGMRLRGMVAVSAGVKDGEAAKAALGERYKLVPAGNGALLIQGLGKPAHPDDGSEDDADDAEGSGDAHRTCELAPSYGTPSTRLVCAEDPKALAELGAWLTRTAPRVAGLHDLSAEVRMGPLHPTLTAFKRMAAMLLGGLLGGRGASQGPDDALMAVATDLLDFAIDLDGLSLEVDLAEPAAQARATLRFSGATSSLTRLATAHPDGGAPPPASFWQLPADADLAVFDRGIDPGDLAKGVSLAAKVLGDKLAAGGVKATDRKALLDALGEIPSSAPVVYASGLDAVTVQKAFDGAKDPSLGREAAQALAEALLGWRLFEVDEPASRLAGAFRDVASAWARPGIAAAYAARPRSGGAPSFRPQGLPRGPGGAALPKGSQHYVLALPLADDRSGDSAKKGARPLTLHVLLVPDATRTWVGVGGDAALVTSKMTGAIGAAGVVRADLAPLDHEKVGAAGFLDVRSLPEAVVEMAVLGGGQLSVLGVGPVPGALSALDMITALPHRGLTPIPFSLTAQPGNVVVAGLRVPRAAIEDAIVALLSPGKP